MAITRSYEIWFVASFLSRFGSRSVDRCIDPPDSLHVGTWKEAYDLFYGAINGGRAEQYFRNSLKNARDSYDSHLAESGRIGWGDPDLGRPPRHLGERVRKVVQDWEYRKLNEISNRISEMTKKS